MSADLLRRAAAKLREHAEAATPGPWNADPSEIYGETIATWVAESLNGNLPDAGEANSRYIALMHPPVALALADLLDYSARWFEAAEKDGYEYDEGEALPIIALARAVLREPEDGAR
jgi:hypothetical protein